MAMSSIFTNFTITDEKSAERFLDALDKASEQPAWKSRIPFSPPVRDPNIIRDKMAKRKILENQYRK